MVGALEAVDRKRVSGFASLGFAGLRVCFRWVGVVALDKCAPRSEKCAAFHKSLTSSVGVLTTASPDSAIILHCLRERDNRVNAIEEYLGTN